MVDENLLAQAVAELGITVPVMRAEASGKGLKLWLYGRDGKPVTWTPKAASKPKSKPKARITRKKAVKDE